MMAILSASGSPASESALCRSIRPLTAGQFPIDHVRLSEDKIEKGWKYWGRS
jgi:hypothetical protein